MALTDLITHRTRLPDCTHQPGRCSLLPSTLQELRNKVSHIVHDTSLHWRAKCKDQSRQIWHEVSHQWTSHWWPHSQAWCLDVRHLYASDSTTQRLAVSLHLWIDLHLGTLDLRCSLSVFPFYPRAHWLSDENAVSGGVTGKHCLKLRGYKSVQSEWLEWRHSQ